MGFISFGKKIIATIYSGEQN